MKKEHLFTALLLIVLTLPVALSAQTYSYVNRYLLQKGTNVLIRCNRNKSYFVTSYKTTGNRSYFIINNGSTNKHFITTQSPAPNPPMIGLDFPDSGYVINDMYFVGNVCWFCGQRWYWNGEYYLDQNGNGHKYLTYMGYIGKFDMDEAMSGGGQYQIMTVPYTQDIKRIVVHGDNLTAFGPASVSINNFNQTRPCLIELSYNTNTGKYTFHHEYTTWTEEELLDMVNANGKIVVLSQNTNQNHFMYFRYCFGLRYGTPGNFINTGDTIYNYNTDYILDGNLTAFQKTEKIYLSTTNIGNGVAVSHVIHKGATPNSWKGRFINYLVPSKASTSVQVSYDKGAGVFSNVKEALFNYPIGTTTNISLLLNDTNGSPYICNPLFSTTFSNYTAPVLSIDDPLIESIQPYQGMSNGFDIAVGGHFANDALKVSNIMEHNIHNHLPSWYSMNCFFTQDRAGASDQTVLSYIFYTDIHPLVSGREGTCFFKSVSYQTTTVSPTGVCSDGINN